MSGVRKMLRSDTDVTSLHSTRPTAMAELWSLNPVSSTTRAGPARSNRTIQPMPNPANVRTPTAPTTRVSADPSAMIAKDATMKTAHPRMDARLLAWLRSTTTCMTVRLYPPDGNVIRAAEPNSRPCRLTCASRSLARRGVMFGPVSPRRQWLLKVAVQPVSGGAMIGFILFLLVIGVVVGFLLGCSYRVPTR